MNYLMTINGKSIGDNLEQFEVTNPGTNEVVGLMPKGAENEADQAIQAAEGAFESWANLTAYDRANYLMKLNDLILENKEEMAKLMTLEMGKPITERSEEHTSELQSRGHLVCRLLLEKKKNTQFRTL